MSSYIIFQNIITTDCIPRKQVKLREKFKNFIIWERMQFRYCGFVMRLKSVQMLTTPVSVVDR